TTDLSRRLEEHNNGTGAKYTRLQKRRPVKMIHAEVFSSRSEAGAKKKRHRKSVYAYRANSRIFLLYLHIDWQY
ncbi:GIY-YIG nuclease family protein, partial [Enterococcus faecium]|uniref:GIY-YIG nuclease family protein n=1 Tax=Enterococcus faecium TaxID=1352 RepID=UPI0037C05CCE